MPFEGKAPAEYVFRQPIDRQRDKLPGVVAQQRRGIALQHLTQRGDQTLESVLMTDAALEFYGDARQHINGKAHGVPLTVILTMHDVILTISSIVILTNNKEVKIN